jgi:hypothetical protein
MKPETSLLPADWEVPAKLRGRLGTTAGRQRMLLEDGHLILVLHAPPSQDETGRRGRFFWRDPSGNWKAAPKGEHVANLEQHLNEYQSVIEQLEQAEDVARDARDYFQLLDRVSPLARALHNLHDALQQAREKVSDDRRIIVARDQAYELMRRADLMHEDAKNGLEFAVAWQAEQQAESTYQMAVSTHRLNLLVAFFFPIATLMAVFGTNLQHGLERWNESNPPLPLLAVLAAGFVSGIILTSFVTRRAKRPKREIQSKSIPSSTDSRRNRSTR